MNYRQIRICVIGLILFLIASFSYCHKAKAQSIPENITLLKQFTGVISSTVTIPSGFYFINGSLYSANDSINLSYQVAGTYSTIYNITLFQNLTILSFRKSFECRFTRCVLTINLSGGSAVINLYKTTFLFPGDSIIGNNSTCPINADTPFFNFQDNYTIYGLQTNSGGSSGSIALAINGQTSPGQISNGKLYLTTQLFSMGFLPNQIDCINTGATSFAVGFNLGKFQEVNK